MNERFAAAVSEEVSIECHELALFVQKQLPLMLQPLSRFIAFRALSTLQLSINKPLVLDFVRLSQRTAGQPARCAPGSRPGIELQRAVGRKLVKNSKKRPPLRPGLPGFRVGTGAAGDTETHVLVDWENVQPKDADIRSLVPDVTDIWLFHGPNQKGVAAKHASFGEKATPVKIARTGKNALDFHLSFYMGYIAARHPDARFVVVSNDKGYAPMLEHAAELGLSARQVGFGKSGAVVEAASASSAAKKAAPAEKVAAKKVPTKPAAKKAVAKLPSSPVAKAQAKKVPAAKKAAATKKTASPAAAPTTASVASTSSAAPAVNVSSVIDLKKAISHVVASLRKTTSKPTKRAKLVAAIKSLLGQSADEQAVHSVLAQLLASGKVVIDSNGSVQYAFQSA
jgi:hypothetical protein